MKMHRTDPGAGGRLPRRSPLPGSPLRRAVLVWLVAGLAGGLFIRPAEAVDPPRTLVQGPLIRFSERTWDFGQLRQHVQVSHAFTLRNGGTAPLRILKVEPDCGCTIATPADTILAPGASTTLDVTFTSRDFEGPQRKVVILETNDPAEPRVDLLLLADVVPDISITPSRLVDFRNVPRGTDPVRELVFKAEPKVPFSVSAPTKATEWVQWTVTPDPAAGNAYKVTIHLRPDAPYGRFNERVDVPVRHPKYDKMRITLRGLIHGHFVPNEVGINFGSVKSGRNLERTVKLQSHGEHAFRITKARATQPWLVPTLRTEGRETILTVRLDAPPEPTRIKDRVILETSDPDQPQIEIDVVGTVVP